MKCSINGKEYKNCQAFYKNEIVLYEENKNEGFNKLEIKENPKPVMERFSLLELEIKI